MAILAPRSQAQDTTCMTQLIPCLNYLNSTSSRPSSDCCDPLRSVIKSNPQCLCNMISSNTAASGESSINVTQAMLLPSRCGVSINAATCAAASSPTTRTTESNSASKFLFVNASLAAAILMIIQVLCA
ncbi:hypothetical protein MRB53_003345 [Persea americana]|uniref:Uncharacterized protein n=1 Tax=Persea americana TaxID=3435 RepID=A0ACC2MWY8_PERAE|nr:hypothetical protein MRB53_003345 [Persea americana]